MTKEEYLNAIDGVIYLSGCAVNGTIPDKKRIEGFDLEQLRKAANKHLLTAIVCYALETAGIQDHKLYQAKMKSIRKISAMEIDKKQLFERLEHEKIWYMPLKGTVIKDLYPSIGIRQMSDFDILFDKEYAENVREIMLDLGFTCKLFGKGNQDVYYKQPVSNFEMHTGLFEQSDKPEVYEYYKNIKERLIKDEDNNFGYHFRNEDLYIYLIAHEYKHYSHSGTGLRSLLDTYVWLKNKGGALDWEYVEKETGKIGLAGFEKENRTLAINLFNGTDLSDRESDTLEYILSSGTYGNFVNKIRNRIKSEKSSKLGYALMRFSVPISRKNPRYEVFAEHFPLFYRVKILLPFLPFYRIFRSIKSGRFRREASAIRKA